MFRDRFGRPARRAWWSRWFQRRRPGRARFRPCTRQCRSPVPGRKSPRPSGRHSRRPGCCRSLVMAPWHCIYSFDRTYRIHAYPYTHPPCFACNNCQSPATWLLCPCIHNFHGPIRIVCPGLRSMLLPVCIRNHPCNPCLNHMVFRKTRPPPRNLTKNRWNYRETVPRPRILPPLASVWRHNPYPTCTACTISDTCTRRYSPYHRRRFPRPYTCNPRRSYRRCYRTRRSGLYPRFPRRIRNNNPYCPGIHIRACPGSARYPKPRPGFQFPYPGVDFPYYSYPCPDP